MSRAESAVDWADNMVWVLRLDTEPRATAAIVFGLPAAGGLTLG
jgi:hypothetical protein